MNTDFHSDKLTFADEVKSGDDLSSREKWKVLIVDDDYSVHEVTRMILANFQYDGRGLELLSAYSEDDAKKCLNENLDTALVLLDVVMDSDDSGLKLTKYIREELANSFIRIVLRTGQPGQAPKKEVIVEYDINDYKLKTELTADKLFVTLVTALRSYQDLMILDHNRRGLERIIDSSATLFKQQSFREFISGVLIQMTSLMHLDKNAMYCRSSGFSIQRSNNEYIIEAGIGDFKDYVHHKIDDVLDEDIINSLHLALEKKKSLYFEKSFVAYFQSKSGNENAVYIRSNQEIDVWDKKLIAIFCTNISVALDNIYLGQDIENTQKDIIFTLGEVAEARSRETGHHVKRVAEYSCLLARKYGLDEEDVEMIRLAAPMHDVGKLAIPDGILHKPGRLTDEEMMKIRTHARAGYDMLKNTTRPILKKAAVIALEHHERFDGTGYPLGKKGYEIDLAGRIVAVADVYDALGCDRVYKKAWPEQDILKFFKAEKGKQFDPDLVDILLDSLDEIKEISIRFAEEF